MTLKASFNLNSKAANDKLKIVLFEAMLQMQNTAKRLAPVDTARLRRSIKISPTILGANKYVLFTNVEYAAAQEFGTKPHVITAKNKKALSFKKQGKNIIVKKVNHPGFPAQPYFRPALFRMKQTELKKLMNKHFKKDL